MQRGGDEDADGVGLAVGQPGGEEELRHEEGAGQGQQVLGRGVAQLFQASIDQKVNGQSYNQ